MNHYKRTHEGNAVLYACKYCEKKFKTYSTRRAHEQDHLRVKIECDTCGKRFTSSCGLDTHNMVICNKDGRTREFGCDKCDRKFRLPSQAKSHQRTHSTDNTVYCAPCGTFFKNKFILRQHLLTSPAHVDEKTFRYPCTKCPRPSNLQRHNLAVHLDKSFGCHIRGKKFNLKSSQTSHIRKVHQGYKKDSRDFVCDVCGNGFTSQIILIIHIRTHTGERPFVYKLCGRAFRQTAALHTHNELVHLKIKRVLNRKRKSKITSQKEQKSETL